MGLAEASERRRSGSKLVADIKPGKQRGNRMAAMFNFARIFGSPEFISNCTLLSDAISLQDGRTPVFFLKATPNTHLQTLAIQLQPRRS